MNVSIYIHRVWENKMVNIHKIDILGREKRGLVRVFRSFGNEFF